MQNEKPSIKVPLYRTEGNPGLQVGRCSCVTKRRYGNNDLALGISSTPEVGACSVCDMCFFDYTTNNTGIAYSKNTFVSWAYSTPERRK